MKKHSTPVDLGVLQRERDVAKREMKVMADKLANAADAFDKAENFYKRAVARLQIASKTIVEE